MGLKCIDLDRVKSTDKHFISKLMNPLRSEKDSTQYQNCKISGRITAPHIDQLLLITGAASAANLRIAHRIQVNGHKLYCKEYSRMKRRVCYVVCFVNGTIMSIQYFALNVNSGLVYAVGEMFAVTADCFLKEKSGHHILKVTNTNNHSLGV
jgi:hypothetical protein